MKGRFFVIDGIGGTGKTTQTTLLRRVLRKRAVFSQEPGGAPRAEKIRDILKSGKGKEPHPLTDFFLFWAARAEHVNEKIRVALQRGQNVVCDRFDSSTFAMQIRGDKQKSLEKLFWQCREHTLKGAEPDAYIILDASPKVVRTRREIRGKDNDRFDDRDDVYQSRIRAGYKEFAKRMGKRAFILDAHKTIDAVHQDIMKIIHTLT